MAYREGIPVGGTQWSVVYYQLNVMCAIAVGRRSDTLSVAGPGIQGV